MREVECVATRDLEVCGLVIGRGFRDIGLRSFGRSRRYGSISTIMAWSWRSQATTGFVSGIHVVPLDDAELYAAIVECQLSDLMFVPKGIADEKRGLMKASCCS